MLGQLIALGLQLCAHPLPELADSLLPYVPVDPAYLYGRSVSRVLFPISKYRVSVIYLRLLSPTGSSGLPSDVGRATLVDAGLHDLTTPKMHSTHIAIRLVSSYLTFSPLPFLVKEKAVIFFCITLSSRTAFC